MKELGLANEQSIDLMDETDLLSLEGWGVKSIKMVRDARNEKDCRNLMEVTQEDIDETVFPDDGIDKNEYSDDGLMAVTLNIRLLPRHWDWLERLSKYAQELNSSRKEEYTVEKLVVRFILDARRMDDTDAGRKTSSTTHRA